MNEMPVCLLGVSITVVVGSVLISTTGAGAAGVTVSSCLGSSFGGATGTCVLMILTVLPSSETLTSVV